MIPFASRTLVSPAPFAFPLAAALAVLACRSRGAAVGHALEWACLAILLLGGVLAVGNRRRADDSRLWVACAVPAVPVLVLAALLRA